MSILNETQIIDRLHDTDPTRRIIITPLINPAEQFGPTSVDLRLGPDFMVMRRSNLSHLDPCLSETTVRRQMSEAWREVRLTKGEPFILHPGEFALAATLEHVRIPLDLAARLEGRSTWGRLGLQIHATAGFVDPGFAGALTFELSNVSMVPLSLYPGVRIGQLCFFASQTSALPYTAKTYTKYSGKPSTAASAFYKDPEYARLRQANHPQTELVAR
jgi:dCTP deaminase